MTSRDKSVASRECLTLAERCEAADRPDRGLDGAINDIAGRHPTMPAYTASLDAAMTLVPEGWSGRAAWCEGAATADICERELANGTRLKRAEGTAAAPALALCAAALRARAGVTQ